MEANIDPGGAHGRLWYAENCPCPECRAAIARRAWEAEAQSRSLDAPEPDKRSVTDKIGQEHPIWWRPHKKARYRVRVPAGTAAKFDTVMVVTPSTGRRTKIQLGTQLAQRRFEDGLMYDLFYPVR